ncbi:MAG: Fic family protein [Candidatus Margulisiibacteriota bacterium]|jgi:Fic family protein
MKMLERPFFSDYSKQIDPDIEQGVKSFEHLTADFDLGYQFQAAAVFSSNIEGNSLDLNSYMNLKMRQQSLKENKEVKEIDDLIYAYRFSLENTLSEVNFLKAHQFLTKTILSKSKQGKYRNEPIGVFNESGLVYLAIEANFLGEVMHDFFEEIQKLLLENHSICEILYFASLIHLRFVHIHPFLDGNGRAARLLEKWFLASKLGEKYWKLQSEKYYKQFQKEYYQKFLVIKHISRG